MDKVTHLDQARAGRASENANQQLWSAISTESHEIAQRACNLALDEMVQLALKKCPEADLQTFMLCFRHAMHERLEAYVSG